MNKNNPITMNQQEFEANINKLSDLYEEHKQLIYGSMDRLTHSEASGMLNRLSEMRDTAATAMQDALNQEGEKP